VNPAKPRDWTCSNRSGTLSGSEIFGLCLEELTPERPQLQLFGLLLRQPRGQEVLHSSLIVQEGHHPVEGRR